ncbi:MAG: B12-binding domain-containing radical SAM protein [Magnetococcales bacterium]|nr:B12-binding domain-containing radical SAM protein [Magnetococcales bacterium]
MAEQQTCNILFIVPPHIPYNVYSSPKNNIRHIPKKDGRMFAHLISDMPLGILSLSAYIKKYSVNHINSRLIDYNVELNELETFDYCDFNDFYIQEIKKNLNGFSPDIIGISSLFTSSYQNLLDLIAISRKLCPDALIIAGGSVPSILQKEIFDNSPGIDALCYGEGEKPLLGLVDAIDRKAFLEEHPSWITATKNQNGFSPANDFILDLDEIPFSDYDLCDSEKYAKYPAVTAYAGIKERQTNYYVMSSRGCPFKCIFCAAHKVHGRDVRFHSLQRVKEDLTRLRDKHGATIIVFQDDHIMADKKRALEIIKFVDREKINAFFQNLAVYALNREMLEALASAGTTHLNLSIESGSERVLKKIMLKPLKLSIVKQVTSDCRDLGIYTAGSILIGLPGETKEDIMEARQVLKTLGVNWYVIFCASPLIGSDMHNICTEKNYLKDSGMSGDYSNAVVETEEFTAEYIQEMAYIMNLELNFVENSDCRLGDYQLALKGFESAIRAKSDHAFGYHFAAICYKNLGQIEKANSYQKKAQDIYSTSEYWRNYFKMFNIEP